MTTINDDTNYSWIRSSIDHNKSRTMLLLLSSMLLCYFMFDLKISGDFKLFGISIKKIDGESIEKIFIIAQLYFLFIIANEYSRIIVKGFKITEASKSFIKDKLPYNFELSYITIIDYGIPIASCILSFAWYSYNTTTQISLKALVFQYIILVLIITIPVAVYIDFTNSKKSLGSRFNKSVILVLLLSLAMKLISVLYYGKTLIIYVDNNTTGKNSLFSREDLLPYSLSMCIAIILIRCLFYSKLIYKEDNSTISFYNITAIIFKPFFCFIVSYLFLNVIASYIIVNTHKIHYYFEYTNFTVTNRILFDIIHTIYLALFVIATRYIVKFKVIHNIKIFIRRSK